MASRVAIAIAVHDDERYVRLALDALRDQSYRDFTVTVYDDGSEDRSADVVQSYEHCLDLRLFRGEHCGRQLAKQRARERAGDAPYLLVLDADVVLPRDGLERMVAVLDGDARVAAVSARARARPEGWLGGAQACMEDLFYASNASAGGDARWIVGGCVLLRRSAIDGLALRVDVGEDNDLSEKLRGRWRLVAPPELVATHHGVPTTWRGVLRRFEREGVRVCALMRAYPRALQVGTIARLAPLPVAAAGVVGLLTLQAWVAGGAAAILVAYAGAFFLATRNLGAARADRAGAALLFTVGNVAFGVGFVNEVLKRGARPLQEGRRAS